MTREEFLKQKISEKGYTIKSFSEKIGIADSTLRSMLKRSVGGAAVDNVIKVCKGLGITVENLQSCIAAPKEVIFSDHEKNLILAYRARPEMQSAVNTLLGITNGPSIADDVSSVLEEAAAFKTEPIESR